MTIPEEGDTLARLDQSSRDDLGKQRAEIKAKDKQLFDRMGPYREDLHRIDGVLKDIGIDKMDKRTINRNMGSRLSEKLTDPDDRALFGEFVEHRFIPNFPGQLGEFLEGFAKDDGTEVPEVIEAINRFRK